jgi:hypothetical protein
MIIPFALEFATLGRGSSPSVQAPFDGTRLLGFVTPMPSQIGPVPVPPSDIYEHDTYPCGLPCDDWDFQSADYDTLAGIFTDLVPGPVYL